MNIDKRKKTVAIALGLTIASAIPALTSCDDNSTIGSSIIQDEMAIVVNDTSFTLTGQSVVSDTILSRTITQLLGSIDAPDYGSLSSDFVTQFMPSLQLDTIGVSPSEIDSLKLVLCMDMNAYTGDSLAPMGLEVYRLTENLKSPIYSTFRPNGKYDPNKVIGSTIYNASSANVPDSLKKQGLRNVEVTLPRELGQELYQAYKTNPANFADPESFAKNVFKGLYIKNSYGSGRIIRIARTTMRMYYHLTAKIADTDRDTTLYYVGNYFAVTPEVISNNNLNLRIAESVNSLVKEGNSIVLAPAGLDVEINFPAPQILQNYRQNVTNLGVINSLTLQIPAVQVANKYNIAPPQHLLMVLKNKKKEFFAESKINDDLTSFYAAYDSSTKSYIFTGLRDYIINLLKKDKITPDDYTFTLVPVTVITETSASSYYQSGSTYVTSKTPNVSNPAMFNLKLDNAKKTLVYTKQTLN